MININKVLDIAIKNDASDVHLIKDLKPIMRISRELVEIEEEEVLGESDLYDAYDFFVRGNIDKDEIYKEVKRLDTSYEYGDVRLRVNISSADDMPIFTLRIIKNTLPRFEELGVPDIVRRMTLQPQGLKPIEFKHTCKKSIIVQKEVGKGGDVLNFRDGVKNSLREDCDILVIGEIRDKETMEAAIDMAESGHLVIGTLHTKSCAETIDRMINFYEVRDQASIKYLMSSLLKLVVSQRLLKGLDGKLVLLPEVMVVDNVVSGCIRKERFSVSELEDAIQSNSDKGNVSLINSIAKLFVDEKISLAQAKSQIEEKNIETLNRTIMQMKIKRG